MTRDPRPVRRGLRRLAIGVLGGALLALGLVLLVLPGPGLLVIPAALGLLGLEFEAPRRGHDALRRGLRALRERRGAPRA